MFKYKYFLIVEKKIENRWFFWIFKVILVASDQMLAKKIKAIRLKGNSFKDFEAEEQFLKSLLALQKVNLSKICV